MIKTRPTGSPVDCDEFIASSRSLWLRISAAIKNSPILRSIFSCAIGLHTRGGAEDVGLATTRSIVWTMTVIFIVNYIVQ